MDDIRRPHAPQRRDYTNPSVRPPAPQPQSIPVSRPLEPQAPSQPAPAPSYHPPQQPTQLPSYHHIASHHQSPHTHHAKKRRLPKPLIIILAIFVATGLFAAGFFLKSSGPEDTIPSKIVKQVDYNLYFPSPMPPGYTYMKDTATFQIGQVFYKFSNGRKRVTVKEEPMPQPKPNLDLLSGYTQFDSRVGKVAIGSTFGQPTAVILAGGTVITMNTSGGVSPDDLKLAINNLKDIGKNPGKQNG